MPCPEWRDNIVNFASAGTGHRPIVGLLWLFECAQIRGASGVGKFYVDASIDEGAVGCQAKQIRFGESSVGIPGAGGQGQVQTKEIRSAHARSVVPGVVGRISIRNGD